MKTLAGKTVLLVGVMAALSFLLSAFLVVEDVRGDLEAQTREVLRVRTGVVAQVLEDRGAESLLQSLGTWKERLHLRITLVDPQGRVLGDSDIPREKWPDLSNHRTRPEVREALQGGEGFDTRYSESTGVPYLYEARRVSLPPGPLVVRTSMPQGDFDALLGGVRRRLFASLALAALLSLGLGIWGVRRITRPLGELAEAAGAVERGETPRFPTSGGLEIRRLSGALKHMAERLTATLGDLEEEREQLRRLVESLPVGVLLVDPRGRVRYANDALKGLLRDLPSRLEGAPVQGALRHPPLVDLIERTAWDPQGGDRSVTFRVPGEQERVLRAQTVRVHQQTLAVVQDLTEQALMEEARKSFVADAGHELQTPLTALRAAAELLLSMEDSTAPERAPYLQRIVEQQERMTDLVDDLLLLSRLESGVPAQTEEDLDLAALLEALAEQARQHPLATGLDFRVHLPESAPFRGRPEELRRAFGNLLENGVKYTQRRFGDRPGGTLSLSLTSSPEGYRIQVEDNGVGIPVSMRERIFERFERAEKHRARGSDPKGGYGLGLAIARRALEGHGGTLELEDREEGTGAAFRILLPRKGR